MGSNAQGNQWIGNQDEWTDASQGPKLSRPSFPGGPGGLEQMPVRPGGPGIPGYSPMPGGGGGGHYGFINTPGDMNMPWQPPQQNPGMPMPGGPRTPVGPGGPGDIYNDVIIDRPGPGIIGAVDHGNPGQPPQVQNPGMPGGGGILRPGTPVQQPIPGPRTPPVARPVGPNGFAHGDRGSNFGKAAAFAKAGNMGKAKQAITAGGGTWGGAMHKFLKGRG